MTRHTRAVAAGRARQRATRRPIRVGTVVMLTRGSPSATVTAYDGANVTCRFDSGITGTYHKSAIRVIHNRYVH